MTTKRQTLAGRIIADALAAEPHVATRTLARRLYKEHLKHWPSLNSCDCAIRRQRGALGEMHRRMTPHVARPPEEVEACHRWGGVIPEGERSEWAWQELPTDVSRWLIMADLHIPYHDHNAIYRVLDHAEGKCDGVLILGDGIDFHAISHWLRDPERRDVEAECEVAKEFLDGIQKALKPKRIVWKSGNHEARLPAFVMTRLPELWSLVKDTLCVPGLLGFKERSVIWVRDQDPIRHHELVLIHGHEQGNRFANPVNPARGLFTKLNECSMCGHEHRSSSHTENSVLDRVTATWSLGCLCDLHPSYRSLGHKWTHGFAYLNAGKEWSVENFKILKGRVVPS